MATWLDSLNSATQWYADNPFVSDVAVPTALSLYNQYQQGQAADKGTQQVVSGINQGIGSLNQFWQQAQAGSAPYQQFGVQGMQGYSDILANPNAITQTPDYQFRFQQGQQALERSAAAKGMLMSGNTLQDLQQYGQGLASTELDAALKRRLPMIETGLTSERSLSQLGAGYAEGLGRMYQERGGAQAIGTGAGADITSTTLGDIGNVLGNLGTAKNIGTVSEAGSQLMNAGGGTVAGAAKAAGLVGKETAGQTGSWADLSAGPRKLGTTTAAAPASVEALPAGASATEAYTAAQNAGLVSAPLGQFAAQYAAFLQSGMGASQAAMLAAQTAEFGAAGTAATLGAAEAGAAGAAAGGAGTGGSAAGGAGGFSGALGGLGVGLAMLAALKFISSTGTGGPNTKLSKLSDDTPEQVQASIDGILNNTGWAHRGKPEADNYAVINKLMDAGLVAPNDPRLVKHMQQWWDYQKGNKIVGLAGDKGYGEQIFNHVLENNSPTAKQYMDAKSALDQWKSERGNAVGIVPPYELSEPVARLKPEYDAARSALMKQYGITR